MVEAYGAETNGWVGQEVELWVDPYVLFSGKPVGGLKLTPKFTQTPLPVSVTEGTTVGPAPTGPDDDIPF